MRDAKRKETKAEITHTATSSERSKASKEEERGIKADEVSKRLAYSFARGLLLRLLLVLVKFVHYYFLRGHFVECSSKKGPAGASGTGEIASGDRCSRSVDDGGALCHPPALCFL